jgi:hypothetical protein
MSEYQIIAKMLNTLESNLHCDNIFKSGGGKLVEYIKLSCIYSRGRI